MDLAKLHLHWRTSHYKGNSYRSYSLARAYREHGKNRKEIVLKLGRLSNDEAQRWRSLLQTVKKPGAFVTTLDDLVVTRHYAYLDVASAVLTEPAAIEDGSVTARGPGLGMEWNEDAVRKYAL